MKFLRFLIFWVYRASDSMVTPTLKSVGTGSLSSVACFTGAKLMIFFCIRFPAVVLFWQSRDLQLSRNTLYLLRSRLCFFIILKRDLFVYCDD